MMRFEHEGLGRVTGVHRPDTSVVCFDYEANGNMTLLTNAGFIDYDFTYNPVASASTTTPPKSAATGAASTRSAA